MKKKKKKIQTVRKADSKLPMKFHFCTLDIPAKQSCRDRRKTLSLYSKSSGDSDARKS